MRDLLRVKFLCLPAIAFIAAFAGCTAGEKTAATPAAGSDAKTDAAATAPATAGDTAPAPAPEGGIPGTPAAAGSGAPVPGAGPAPGAPGSMQPPPSPLTPSGPPGQVVAKVNSTTITRGQFDFTVKNIVGDQNVPPDKQAEFRRRVLDEMIDRELLYQKAVASNVTLTDAELTESMSKIKAGFPDEKAFAAQLAKDSMDVAGIQSIVRHAMVIDKYVKAEIIPKVKVTPEDEAKFYEESKEKMKRPAGVRASHILIRAAKDAPADQKAAAKVKADEALAKAKKGDDFAALAKEYSQDPGSAPNGGDLGFFPKGQMVPEFDAAAWSMQKGQISGIVVTDFGYHIIKVTDKRPEGYAPIEEVRPQIKDYLNMQKTQQDLQKLAQSLRATAKIDVTL